MEMTTEESISELKWVRKVNEEILKADAKEIDVDSAWIKHWENVVKSLDVAIETMRKYQKIEDFAKWVATEVIDEEMWTYNHLSFPEIACRKLVQLGIMQESDGEYTYEVVENGNDD
jgi:hypothetical protein